MNKLKRFYTSFFIAVIIANIKKFRFKEKIKNNIKKC